MLTKDMLKLYKSRETLEKLFKEEKSYLGIGKDGNGVADSRYWLDHTVTATQKTIFKAFGMNADTIRKNANRITFFLEQRKEKVTKSKAQYNVDVVKLRDLKCKAMCEENDRVLELFEESLQSLKPQTVKSIC